MNAATGDALTIGYRLNRKFSRAWNFPSLYKSVAMSAERNQVRKIIGFVDVIYKHSTRQAIESE